jgi:hypothetical protein
VARVYPLPKCIGTDVTNCGHSEIGALNMGIDWFSAQDPCMHILDSNATAFNARAMRDEAIPTMRKRIRGTGVAAGKGECERLRASIRAWKETSDSDEREPWNQRQRINLKRIVEEMQEWNQPNWPKKYRDADTNHPIMLVDSHQLDDRGKLTKQRYKSMVPCKAMVTANELADKICMVTLGIKGTSHCLQTIPTPADIRYPPNTLRFTFSNMGRTFNGDTPATIERLVRDTLWRAAAKKQEQGRILRILDKVNLTAEIIGRKGALSNLLRHLAQSHSQNYYRGKEYKDLHDEFGKVPKLGKKQRQRQKELNTLCPFCKHIPDQYQAKANIRHYHLYCPNQRIAQVRHKTNRCLEVIVSKFIKIAAEIKEIASINDILWDTMNRRINELAINDCAIKKAENMEGIMGTPYTLNVMQWDKIYNDHNHERHPQAYCFPYSSAIGLITSRKEWEWNDKHTNSSDLTYLGAIPLALEEAIREYCRDATRTMDKQQYEKCQNKCKELNQQWKKIEVVMRAKPIIIQKAISAQLQQYKKDMQEKRKEREAQQINEEANESDEDEAIEEEKIEAEEELVSVSRICIGMKCHLTQTPKQFISKGTTPTNGPKKCTVCRTFEPALNKCLEIEKYIVAQIKEPDEDIDMFDMLRGLSGLMIESKGRTVKNSSYFEEILRIPIVKKILKNPEIHKKKRVYALSVIKPMEMIAATFGIALTRGAGSPFPGLTLEKAKELWTKDTDNKNKRDMWEQLQWNIKNYSIGERLKDIEAKIKYIGADAKNALARAGRVTKIKDRPYSIITTLPRRTRGIWDSNTRKRHDKIDTARKAIKMRQPISPNEKLRIQQATQRKNQREEMLFQKRNLSRSRQILGNLTNTNTKRTNEAELKVKIAEHSDKAENIKSNKRRDPEDDSKTIHDRPSPVKASRTNIIRRVKQLETMIPNEGTQANKILDLCSDDDEPISKMIELSSDEEEPENPKAQAMPILFNLSKASFRAIETKLALMRGECIQAIIEMIHRDTSRRELSCVSTDFLSHLIKRKITEAKNLLHPDKGCQKADATWITSKSSQATAQSRVLLIPCHIIKENKQKEIIMSHWVLAVRIRIHENKHKLLVFDSCGIKAARKQLKEIRKQLMKINLLEKNDAWEALSLKEQTEQECGIRMAIYMLQFSKWARTQQQPDRIIQQIHSTIAHEKTTKVDLASEYRKQIYQVMQREQNRLRK